MAKELADMQKLVNQSGLVPLTVTKSEAGAGLVAGEVRGYTPENALALVNGGWADIYVPTKAEIDAAKKDATDRAAAAEQIAKTGAVTGVTK